MPRRTGFLSLLMLTVLTGCSQAARAEPTASSQKPVSPPASPAPAEARHPDPQLDRLLDRIEAATDGVQTLTARLRYDRIQGLLDDEQRRFGQLAYQAGPPARFDARFDKLLVDGHGRKIDLRFTYDGVWLAERDGQDKTFTRRQLAEAGASEDAPRHPGKPMGLGDSPFALPLDARKADLLERFEVTQPAPADDDPADTCHLRLIPKPHLRLDQNQIDLWYDSATMLPRRMRTTDNSQNTSVIDLMKVQVNPQLDDARFDTTAPRGGGWDVQIVPLEEDEEHRAE